MAATVPGWELYRSFLAVLRHGSLSGAARALGLTQPTIGRHVEALEAALQRSLFTRAPSGLLPTAEAELLRPYAETLQATTEALLRAASGQHDAVAGTVRVTASEVVAAEVLPPILAALHDAQPGLQIELSASNRTEDLLHRAADIAIRMVRPAQSALLARRIGAVTLGLHAHPHYLARHGTPARLADCAGHALIGPDKDFAALRGIDLGGLALRPELFTLRSDHQFVHLAAIRAGYGIGVCQVPLARRAPALVRVAPDFAAALEVWLVMHGDLRHSPRCRVVFNALAAGLGDYLGAA